MGEPTWCWLLSRLPFRWRAWGGCCEQAEKNAAAKAGGASGFQPNASDPAWLCSTLGMMNDNGHPLWLALGVIALFPIAAAVEIIWAVFSSRVRAYIVRHPIAHFLWFACALF